MIEGEKWWLRVKTKGDVRWVTNEGFVGGGLATVRLISSIPESLRHVREATDAGRRSHTEFTRFLEVIHDPQQIV